jgi:hypothetical protein
MALSQAHAANLEGTAAGLSLTHENVSCGRRSDRIRKAKLSFQSRGVLFPPYIGPRLGHKYLALLLPRPVSEIIVS